MPFVEWMQGLPEGWVDGISKSAALHCLGNCVVPQQAAAALRMLDLLDKSAGGQLAALNVHGCGTE